MKNLLLFIFVVSLFSCSDIENEQQVLSRDLNPVPSYTADYFNFILNQNDFENNPVKNIEKINKTRFVDKSTYMTNQKMKEYHEDLSISVELDDSTTIIHVLPKINDPFKADLYFEQNGIITSDIIEVVISDINVPDVYYVEWQSKYDVNSTDVTTLSNSNCQDGIISCDCEKGAKDVQSIGAAIAFGGWFGCGPCPFVGGAIVVVAGLISLTC